MGLELDWYSKKTILTCTAPKRLPSLTSISSMVVVVKQRLVSTMFWRVGKTGVCVAHQQCENNGQAAGPNCQSKNNWRTRDFVVVMTLETEFLLKEVELDQVAAVMN
ncbi:hypothetical protein R1flu_014414 [Riccia fluitans]|uniref:Uncharacterized protein n=1 Tax=Riccia fluitans TaxID=41844 RepID=A0ABD1YGA1_9MARC